MELNRYLIETRGRILSLLEGVPAAVSSEAVNGSWSVDGIVEHLAVVERGSLVMVKRSLTQAVAAESAIAETADKLKLIEKRVARRGSRIEAPPTVQPTGRFGIWPGSLNAFLEAGAKMIGMAEQVSEEYDLRVLEHPVLGKLTLRQWLWFIAAHSERHAAQIEDHLAGAPNPGLQI